MLIHVRSTLWVSGFSSQEKNTARPNLVRAVFTALSRCSFIRRIIFPQMTQWLPADEGTQLRFEFETEIARLEAA